MNLSRSAGSSFIVKTACLDLAYPVDCQSSCRVSPLAAVDQSLQTAGAQSGLYPLAAAPATRTVQAGRVLTIRGGSKFGLGVGHAVAIAVGGDCRGGAQGQRAAVPGWRDR